MTSPGNDEEFGPFGQSAKMLIDFIFPNSYNMLIIVSPSFNGVGEANIAPQFDRGDFFVISSVDDTEGGGKFRCDISRFSPSSEVEVMLDNYRYEHAILASSDLSILTAWAQAEYAVVGFKGALLDEYGDWLEAMQAIGVVRQIP